MKVPSILSIRTTLTLLVMAASLVACNIGSYDDAVERFNNNAPPPPQPPPQPPPPGANFGPNFSEIQAIVFTPSCATANCHSGGGAAANLNLEAANSYAMLVGIASIQDAGTQRVNPGNPNASYLITKLEGPGTSGGQMPPIRALAQADIDVIRQWISDGAIDDTAVTLDPIRVTSLSPAPGAAVTAQPTQIVAGFDREVDAATVNFNTFILQASGGDTTFGDGNEVVITAASITVPGANPRSAIFDLTGVVLADDTYRVSLLGDGGSVIMDLDANALDGEFVAALPSGDGTAGGDFEAQFTILTPVVIGPTLDQIQAVVFTPTCATSLCHSAGTQAGGLDLSNADTSHLQLVGVESRLKPGAFQVVVNDPDNSYLIQKLEGAMGIVGAVMPPPPLPAVQQSDINEIRQWITDGALR